MTWLKSQVAPAPVIVEIKNINGVPGFSPSPITITQGAIVKWINKDSIAHTVTSDGTAKTPLNSALLSQNQEFSFVFSNVGSFPYHCEPHPFMTGTVIVTAPPAPPPIPPPAPPTPTPIPTPTPPTSISAPPTPAPQTLTTPNPPPSGWFPPWWDKENYTLSKDATLDLKIANIETVAPPAPVILPSTCPTRPPLTIPCPVGQILVAKTDSCGSYAVCEPAPPTTPSAPLLPVTPPPSPTTTTPTTPSSPPHSAAKITYCFDDPIASMSDTEWELVCKAKARGIISGTTKDGKSYFNPKNSINRAEAAKIITVGILKSLGKLSSEQFTSMDEVLKKASRPGAPILFTDIEYNAVGEAPWFAKYVSLANREGIMTGYPDKSFKPSNTLNNVEAYKIIVETGRIASKTVDNLFDEATKKSVRAKEWFMKYVKTLELLGIDHSSEYGDSITRKDFLRIVMEVLVSAGL